MLETTKASTMLKKSQLLVVLVIAAVVAAAPPHHCDTAPTPNCSLVFPSILFLNPCQYVCFERLLLPSISVRKHNDGTLCTPAFGFLGIGTCHNGTCVQPEHSASTTRRPLVHFDRDTFEPRKLTTAERPQSSTAVTKAAPSAATPAKPVETTVRVTRIMP
uniref:Putative secreted protein n=1 Tax=Amblyomma americanum TaxID=6943 RepID=A0A0C9R5L9_AMBAM